MSYEELVQAMDAELNKHADVLMGIDDPETQEMIEVLKQAVCKVISHNNDLLAEAMPEVVEKKLDDIARQLRNR